MLHLSQPENNNQQRQVQEEAEEVKVIMMDNMEKTEERKEKVQDLDERAGELKVRLGLQICFRHTLPIQINVLG